MQTTVKNLFVKNKKGNQNKKKLIQGCKETNHNGYIQRLIHTKHRRQKRLSKESKAALRLFSRNIFLPECSCDVLAFCFSSLYLSWKNQNGITLHLLDILASSTKYSASSTVTMQDQNTIQSRTLNSIELPGFQQNCLR